MIKTYLGQDEQGGLNDLVGRRMTGVRWSEEYLTFETTEGPISFTVYGDCCSYSYLYDFYGVDHLTRGYIVTDVNEHDLQPGDPGYLANSDDSYDGDYVQVYGYRLTIEHPLWGPVTAVFSFRNSSNGYYGGSLEPLGHIEARPDQRALTADVVGD